MTLELILMGYLNISVCGFLTPILTGALTYQGTQRKDLSIYMTLVCHWYFFLEFILRRRLLCRQTDKWQYYGLKDRG